MTSYIAGIALMLIGCLMAIPVVVNLPDSWFGAVLALAMLAIGAALSCTIPIATRFYTTKATDGV
jgi:hypothetical protein